METVDIDITGLGQDGRGVGRIDNRVVFVPGLIPGDRARIRITKKGKTFDEGETVALLRPSPDRVEPFCPSFGTCGGCSLQHLSYPAQLTWKSVRVADALQRIGKVADAQVKTLPTIGMDSPFAYRYKVSMPVRKEGIGFFERHSHRVVAMGACAIQQDTGLAIRDAVWAWMSHTGIKPYDEATRTGLLRHVVLRTSRAHGEVLVTLVLACADPEEVEIPDTNSLIAGLEKCILAQNGTLAGVVVNGQPDATSRILGKRFHRIHGKGDIQEAMGDLVFTISAASFFQVNPEMAEVLYRTATSYAAPAGNETVYDLYCGTGTISCFLARHAGKVIGIESSESAVADAEENARRNGLEEKLHFITGKAESILPALLLEARADDSSTVVLDPPRKGCDPVLLDTLIQMKPERIVYVSCEPSTLARDVRRLCDGGYRLETAQPVDMFPWTAHVECVVVMVRV